MATRNSSSARSSSRRRRPSTSVTQARARLRLLLHFTHASLRNSSAHTPLRTLLCAHAARPRTGGLPEPRCAPRSVASPLTPLVCVSRPAAAASSRCFTASLTIPPPSSPQSASSCARTQSTQSSASISTPTSRPRRSSTRTTSAAKALPRSGPSALPRPPSPLPPSDLTSLRSRPPQVPDLYPEIGAWFTDVFASAPCPPMEPTARD